ncbi:MAG: glycosyltransferase [Bacteroidetes bacterium]|nr:glycosyltransferase [Bacteroidota bacterium]
MRWTAEWAWVLLGLCALLYALYLGMNSMLLRYWATFRPRATPLAVQLPPITVLVCFHNEALVLPDLLCTLAQLDYPDFQVLLVDDRSSDEGGQQAQEWAQSVPVPVQVLAISETPPGWSPRKWALAEGLKAVTTHWVVLTDADCRVPANWLTHFAEAMDPQADILLGSGAYQVGGGLLGQAIAYDTLHTATLYMAAAHCHMPYMGVGRSMAIDLRKVDAQSLLARCRHIASGSDDLLVQYHPHPMRVIPCPLAQSVSIAPVTWREWIARKSRHMGAAFAYKPRYKWLLAGYELAPLALAGSLLVVSSPLLWAVCLAWLVAFLLKCRGLILANKYLKMSNAPLRLCLLDIFQYFYTAVYSLCNLSPSGASWQKRTPPIAKQKTAPS